jgi:hypothetical protein
MACIMRRAFKLSSEEPAARVLLYYVILKHIVHSVEGYNYKWRVLLTGVCDV